MLNKKEQIIKWLKEQGVAEANIGKIITAFPSILRLSIEANLNPKVEWLKEQGIAEGNIGKIITASSQILGLSIEANLKPKVEWLKEQGIAEGNIGKIITAFPNILGFSIKRLEEQIEVLKNFNVDTTDLLTNYPRHLMNSVQTIYAKMMFVQNKMSFGEEDTIEKKLKILKMPWTNFKKQYGISKEDLFAMYPLPEEFTNNQDRGVVR